MSKARMIWKFELPICDDRHVLNLPMGHVRHVAMQRGKPCIWVELQPGWPDEIYAFQWFGTGHRIPDECEWVGTVQDGPFVWHLYRYV